MLSLMSHKYGLLALTLKMFTPFFTFALEGTRGYATNYIHNISYICY